MLVSLPLNWPDIDHSRTERDLFLYLSDGRRRKLFQQMFWLRAARSFCVYPSAAGSDPDLNPQKYSCWHLQSPPRSLQSGIPKRRNTEDESRPKTLFFCHKINWSFWNLNLNWSRWVCSKDPMCVCFFSGMLNIEPLWMSNHIHVLSHIHYQWTVGLA